MRSIWCLAISQHYPAMILQQHKARPKNILNVASLDLGAA